MRFYGDRETNTAVIAGLKYDSSNATEITTVTVGNPTDFGRYRETVYVTESGRFFVCGSGGARTRWSTYNGSMHGPGSGLKALTEDEALSWCEDHDVKPVIIENHFDIDAA